MPQATITTPSTPATQHDLLKLELDHIKQSFRAEIEMLKISIAETKYAQRAHENHCTVTEANRKIERLEAELAEARKVMITQGKEHEVREEQEKNEHRRQMEKARSDLAAARKDMDTQRKGFEAKLLFANKKTQAANGFLAKA